MGRPDCGINLPGATTSNGEVVTTVVGVTGSVLSVGGAVAGVIKGGLAAFASYPFIAAVVAAAVVVAVVIYFTVASVIFRGTLL